MKNWVRMSMDWCKAFFAAGLIFASILQTTAAATAAKVTVPLLHVGSDYFTNATLTPQSSTHVTVIHSRGMTMAKMADLDPELQRQLGFEPAPAKGTKVAANSQTATNTTVLGKLKRMGDEFQAGANQAQADKESKDSKEPPLFGTLRKMKDEAQQGARDARPADRLKNATLVEKLSALATVCGIVGLYFFFCNACRHLCRRAGTPSEYLVWLPVWKRLALYKATGTSTAWFWLWFFFWWVPGLGWLIGFIGWVLCCRRLCEAFQQSRWWVWPMLIPIGGWIVFMHFAHASKDEDNEPAIRSMNSGYAF
jgi:hypothetical protein